MTPILMEILKDRLYDTLFLPENMPEDEAYLFAIPLGNYAGRKIKTWEHTNMLIPAAMPAPEGFAIRQVKCGFYQGGELVDTSSEIYNGTLELKPYDEHKHLSFALLEIGGRDCRSEIAAPRGPYGEGWFEYENKTHPVILELPTQHAFSCVLNLFNKPEVPTEFVVVLCGDHMVPVHQSRITSH